MPFSYVNYNQKSYGIVKANVKGYDLAEASTVGFIEFKDGTGSSVVLQSDNSNLFSIKLSFVAKPI